MTDPYDPYEQRQEAAMSDPDTDDVTQESEPAEEQLGSLSVEDDPNGTVDPGDLAGGASKDDDEPLPDYSEDDLED